MARRLLDSGELSAVELTSSCFKQIKRLNRKLNACLTLCETQALKTAAAADKRLKAGARSLARHSIFGQGQYHD